MATRRVPPSMVADEMGWNAGNSDTMDDIGSERGHVPGRVVDGGVGSGNFQFGAPAVLLDGRGIDLNLFFNYNSRVWHKAGSEMTFDIDRDWIPGWSLGFGKIVMAGDTYFLIDGDGTRHSYNGATFDEFPEPASSLQSFQGHTTDGTFIFNMVSSVDVYAADDTVRLSRTEYQYDQGGLIDNPGIAQYDPRTPYRGNLTQVKRYADAANLNQPVVETRTYDIAGNVRTQSTSCCEQTSFSYTTSTQYAWPELVISGSPSESDPNRRNTAGMAYDYNTGLVMASTDANGRPSDIEYDPNTLRPVRENLSTDAYQLHVYDDLNLFVRDSLYEAETEDENYASRSDKYLDGLGRVVKEIAYGEDNAQDVVEVEFDNLGRAWRQSLPYRSGETPQWSWVDYDSLGRPIKTVSPDLSEVNRVYNPPDPPGASGQPGESIKVIDPWGRERWARSDALGRMVEVAEPNPKRCE